MAIIAEEKREMQSGFSKKISESGAMMMFDALQKSQYSFPIKSTARELLCNGIDSVAEKNMAKEILSGRKKVEDYFTSIEGILYQDSHFDAGYYNLQYLDKHDEISITYVDGPQMSKDKVIFSDTGVGLGGRRLEKYFDLGFSTKRLSKVPIGKWGVGAKSPLSVGVDYFTMESRYNGRLYRFNVYMHTIDSIIPQFDLIKQHENEFVMFGAGTPEEYKVYYEKTDLTNGVTITLEAKKNHKNQYIDAVKSQMLYFDNLVFKVVDEQGAIDIIDYKAEILYEDNKIVMSDNKYYTQPQLLLNKVNYGYIDWDELELETKRGNIGIKVAPEEIDVNISRESVIWTENTKRMVTKRFDEVVEIAAGMIQEELKEPDIIKWIRNCYEIRSQGWSKSSGILSRLAGIVDVDKVKPVFNRYDKLKYDPSNPLPGIYRRYVEPGTRKNRETGKEKSVIKRSETLQAETMSYHPIYLMDKDEHASNRKDKWLFTQHGTFVTFLEPEGTEENMKHVPDELQLFYAKSDTSGIMRQYLWNLIKESSEVKKYSEVEVPASFSGNDNEEDGVEQDEEDTEEEVQEKKVAEFTTAERRKQQGKTIIYPLIGQQCSQCSQLNSKPFAFSKQEIKISDINDWQGQEVYYGNDGDADVLQLIGLLTRDPAWSDISQKPVRSHASNYEEWNKLKWYRLNKDKLDKILGGVHYRYKAYYMQHYFDSSIKVVKVSQSNNKLYRDFKKVQEFFITIKGKTITMSNLLIQWNTARIIRNKLTDCAFLHNFDQFNPKYAQMYHTLCQYVDIHYREVGEHAANGIGGLNQVTYGDLVGHLDNVQKFQEFVINPQATPEAIAVLAGELFGNKDLRDGMAVDPEIMQMMEHVQEFAVACGDMLNWIPVLTGYNRAEKPKAYDKSHQTFNIGVGLAFEINRYLESKGVQDYGKTIGEQIKDSWIDSKELTQNILKGTL